MVDRVARPAAAWQGHRLLDTRCRSQWAPVARLCHRRGPLAAAGADCRRRSAFLRHAVRVRGQALPGPSGRRSAGAGARGVSACQQRPDSLRRLDADHAGRAAAGAAQRPQPCRPSSARWCAPSRSSVRSARTRSSRSISISRRMAATSKAFALLRWPISARSRGGFRSARRRCWSRCRNRRKRDGPTARPRQRARRGTACSTGSPRRAACLPTRSRSPKPSRCRPAAARCRCSRRMPPTAPSPKRRRGVKSGSRSTPTCRKASKSLRANALARWRRRSAPTFRWRCS